VGTNLHSFLVSIPIAVVLWALMLLAVAVAVVLMARPRAAAPATPRSGDGRHPAWSARTATAPAAPTDGRQAPPRSARAATAPAAPSDGRQAPPRSARTAATGNGRRPAWWFARTATAPAASSDGRQPARSARTAGPGRRSASGGPRSSAVFSDAWADGSEEGHFAGSVADDVRFADEVSVAAEHAATTAARARAEWEAAGEALDEAWLAFEEADAAARRTWAATSFPVMSRRRKLGENADRERYLHHAATVACRQRELSIAQLNDVYAHRGWNPRLHPVVQEALLRNAIRENKFAAYQAAQREERAAWQRAETAAEALRALRAEAASAFGRSAVQQTVVSEFWWAEPWTTSELPLAA
jgi:hypothetical protein